MAIRMHRGIKVIQCGGLCRKLRQKNNYFPSVWRAGCGRCKECSREPSRIAQAKYRRTPRGQATYRRHAARRRSDPRLQAQQKESARRWAQGVEGYCVTLLKKHRVHNRKHHAPPPDYTSAWLAEEYRAHPYCSVTGAALSVGPSGRGVGFMDPWSLSVDRIDPKRPYAADNIRFTAKIYNLAKNRFDDNEFREAVLHLLRARPYVLRARETWASANSRPPPGAKGQLAGYRAAMANKRDVAQGRTAINPVDADWVRARITTDGVFGARLVVRSRKRHPLQPTVDRIDPSRAHDQHNCRVVALVVNLGLHAFQSAERELFRLFRLILKPLANAADGVSLRRQRLAPPAKARRSGRTFGSLNSLIHRGECGSSKLGHQRWL